MLRRRLPRPTGLSIVHGLVAQLGARLVIVREPAGRTTHRCSGAAQQQDADRHSPSGGRWLAELAHQSHRWANHRIVRVSLTALFRTFGRLLVPRDVERSLEISTLTMSGTLLLTSLRSTREGAGGPCVIRGRVMVASGKSSGGGRRTSTREVPPLMVLLTTNAKTYKTVLVDISATGARLRGDDFPPVGAELCVTVEQVKNFATAM